MQQAIDVDTKKNNANSSLLLALRRMIGCKSNFAKNDADLICESDAGLLQVGRQAKEERPLYEHQVRLREREIQRLRRVVQKADTNASESQNVARVANEEFARAEPQNVGTVSRVTTPTPHFVVSPRQSQNASPSRQANQRPPTNLDGEGPGSDRMDELMRE